MGRKRFISFFICLTKEIFLGAAKLEFYQTIDDLFVFDTIEQTKITKGTGQHSCSLCKRSVVKRKMKLLDQAEKQPEVYFLCFSCWGGYKNWERSYGGAKPMPEVSWKFPLRG